MLLVVSSLAVSDCKAMTMAAPHEWGKMGDHELIQLGCKYAVTDPDSAILAFGIMADRYSDTRSSQTKEYSAIALNNMGYLYYTKTDYDKSINLLLRAYDICETEHFAETMSAVCDNLGRVYTTYQTHSPQTNMLGKAEQIYKTGIDNGFKSKNWRVVLTLVMSLSSLYYDQGRDLAELEPLFKRLEESPVPVATPLYKYTKLRIKALRAVKRKDYRKAESLMREEMQNIDFKLSPSRYIMRTYLDLINLYELTGDHAKVMSALHEALKVARDNDYPEMTVVVTQRLAEEYDKSGEKEKSKEFRYSTLELKDSLLVEGKLQNVGVTFADHALKKSDKARHEAEEQNKDKRNIIILCIALLAITAAIILVVIYLNHRLRRRNRLLYAQVQQMIERSDDERLQREQRSRALQTGTGTSQTGQAAPDDVTNEGANDVPGDDELALLKIMEVFDNSDEIYSSTFSVDRLAELAGLKTRYVSSVISSMTGKNFASLLGEYRVKEACRMLDNPRAYGNLTIEAISNKVGFKSRTSLRTAFKKVTGMTPSMYQQAASEHQK